jgi:hypothetical protein
MQHWDKSKDEKRDAITRQTNKRKKTGRWCRGKVGVEHVTEMVVNHNMTFRKPCHWFPLYHSYARREEGPKNYRYSCFHSYRCTNCGKYVEYFLKNVEECPNFKPKPAT